MMLAFTNIWKLYKTSSLIAKNPIGLRLRNFNKEPIPVSWEKPMNGWTKLNFDGSSKGKSGRASIGGVVRNHNAEFLLGYAESIGKANSTIAELTALRRGLDLVIENGWNDVWLEGDDKTLVEVILKRRKIKSVELQKQFNDINSVINKKLNNCIVSHVYREGNRAADKFAQMGHRFQEPQIWFGIPPYEVLPIVHDDAQGKIVLRTK